MNLKLSEGGFHPTTLVYFRQWLIEHAKADVAMRAVLEALLKEGFLIMAFSLMVALVMLVIIHIMTITVVVLVVVRKKRDH